MTDLPGRCWNLWSRPHPPFRPHHRWSQCHPPLFRQCQLVWYYSVVKRTWREENDRPTIHVVIRFQRDVVRVNLDVMRIGMTGTGDTHVASDVGERTTIDSDVGFAKSKRHYNRQELMFVLTPSLRIEVESSPTRGQRLQNYLRLRFHQLGVFEEPDHTYFWVCTSNGRKRPNPVIVVAPSQTFKFNAQLIIYMSHACLVSWISLRVQNRVIGFDSNTTSGLAIFMNFAARLPMGVVNVGRWWWFQLFKAGKTCHPNTSQQLEPPCLHPYELPGVSCDRAPGAFQY
jgi:hypothetical protein